LDTGLSGKTALITGGSSGIGRAIALALAAEGVDIAIGDIKKDDETLREIEAHGVRAQYIPTDVSDEAQIVQMVSSALATFEHLDLFINNAAVAHHQPITRITSDMWLKTIHTNLSACVWACREICRHMVSRQQGSILIVGSTAQYTQAYKEAAYHISKTGLRVFKNTLALEMAPFGVRVNMLVPGHHVTELTRGIPENTEAVMKQQIPMRRFGDPNDLGASALLLLSDRLSPYTTGAELAVDGGLHLRPLPLFSDDEIRAMNTD
jgi:NAD(P)-dependent dehydrogenase (short-subunit alcohol dehydrogenase family)